MQVHSWGIAIVDTAPARFFASVVPVVRILHGSDICSLEREAEMLPLSSQPALFPPKNE
jgi:hypothetical protein